MRPMFFVMASLALLLTACGAGAVFAPSLQQQPLEEYQFPWVNENPDTDAELTPAEPMARQDYESPIRVDCLEIQHSGRWRLANNTAGDTSGILTVEVNGVVANSIELVSDHEGWLITIYRTGETTPRRQLLQANNQIIWIINTAVNFMSQALLTGNPEAFEQVPEAERQRVAQAVARDRLNLRVSQLVQPRYASAAASFSLVTDDMNMLNYGLLTDYNDPNSGVIVTVIWPSNESGLIPLMDATEIAANIRIVENCE